MGYRACTGARSDSTEQGNVGAGAGATVGKVLGLVGAVKGGLGTASVRVGGFTVGALVVVNALGDVIEPDRGVITAGARDPDTGAYVDAERWLLRTPTPRPGRRTPLWAWSRPTLCSRIRRRLASRQSRTTALRGRSAPFTPCTTGT
ncbi:MAG: P1 family peptidase [Chloroflexia bacterium]